MIIIGLVGCKRVGKDTFADILIEELGKESYHIERYNLARPLYKLAADIFKLPLKTVKLLTNSETPILGDISMRDVLKNAALSLGKKFIIDKAEEFIATTNADIVVITDVRKQIEADFIRNNGGYLICLKRDEIVCDEYEVTVGTPNIECEFNVTNIPMHELRDKARNIANLIKYSMEGFDERGNIQSIF